MTSTPATLVFVPTGRRPLVLPLLVGRVIVVSDASGLMPNGWENRLLTPSESGTARIIQDGRVVPKERLCFVGFGESLPECTVREYLQVAGTEIDALLQEFELVDVASLSCTYLPPNTARQVSLLRALLTSHDALVLNDPFLPFNGRWRESFAEFVVNTAAARHLSVIACNVGFLPKTWGASSTVSSQDIASLLPMTQEAKQAAHAAKVEAPTETRVVNDLNEAYYAAGIPIPASAIKVYYGARDWIFAPMAEASRFLRTWSGMVVTGGLAFVLVTMGVIFVPNIFESHSLLKKISQRFNWKWSDIATAANTALTAPTPASPQDLTAQNPAEAKETSQVVAAASDTNNQDLGAPEVPVEAVDNHALSLLTLNPQSPPDTLAPSCREPFTRVLADTLLLECPPFEVCRLRELAPTLSRDEELISQGKTSSLGSD